MSRIRILVAAAVGPCVSLASAGTTYTIVELDTLTRKSSMVTALTGQGTMCGWSAVSGGSEMLPDGTIISYPIVNHGVTWTAEPGPIEDLGVLGPDVPPDVFPKPESMAFGINASGKIVGRSNQPGQNYQAFLWLPVRAGGFPAGMNQPPDLGGGTAQAWDINDANEIVGEARPTGSIGPRAVRWTFAGGAWNTKDLGDLGGPYARARAINQLGQIVGQANAPGGSLKAFLWLPAPAYGLSTGIHNLVPQFGSSDTTDINELGEVVGTSGALGGFIWLPTAHYGLPAGASMLSAAGIPNAIGVLPAAINDDGIVVGQVVQQFFLPGGQSYITYRAMIWQNGVMHKLNDYLPAGATWDLTDANDINDAGRIVGGGFAHPGDEWLHGFIMDPFVPVIGDLDGDGDVDAADLAVLLAEWGNPRSPADLDGNGTVDAGDLAVLLAAWSG